MKMMTALTTSISTSSSTSVTATTLENIQLKILTVIIFVIICQPPQQNHQQLQKLHFSSEHQHNDGFFVLPFAAAISTSVGANGSGGGALSSSSSSSNLPINSATLEQQQLRYDAPDDCHYWFLNEQNDVSLICNLRTVNSEFDTTNFSVIPTEHTASLTIICNDDIFVKSALLPNSFSHLIKLKELQIEYCKITKFTKNILSGLQQLKNFTLRTHNIMWQQIALDIEMNSFDFTQQLERLDLSQNNIWTLPDKLFCNLNDLIFLNMSENHLQDVHELCFRDRIQIELSDNSSYSNISSITTTTMITTTTTTTTMTKIQQTTNSTSDVPRKSHQKQQRQQQQSTCPPLDLEILDVSFNQFIVLPAKGFGILRRLKQLKLNNNEISMISDSALHGLRSLQVINLNSNKIVALPSELFADQKSTIQEIYLQNNSITVLSSNLFAHLEQLQALDLSHNQITSMWLNKNTFTGLIRLVLLNLSHNKITKLKQEIFRDLYTLQILNLRYNQLENIEADTFSPMNNLHTLLLSHNKLKYLDAYALNGLYVLSLLSLDNNVLIGVHPDAFRNCSSLQDLNLNGNQLKSIPLALRNMRLLRTIDLGENMISLIEEPGFRGLNNLYGLRLIGNYLENITQMAFKDLPSLQILNLARNRIQLIETGAFEMTSSIQAIRLDGNELIDITGLFTNMPNLLWLNISDNKLDTFDFSQIPNSLQWLDIHKNDIMELSSHYGLDMNLRLQTLDASFNRLTHVTPTSIPNSIELLFLNDNLISLIEPHSFLNKINLTRVDLYANQITTLDIKALRLLPVPEKKLLPEFYIGGNPFICDCTIDWLQKINQITSRQYPRIMDLETIYCKLLNNRERAYVQLIEAEPKDFLCTYKTHCFALCHCCEFDACDCEMTCPNNCTCFHDQSWSVNVVECSSAGYEEMPTNIPMDTTEVYIDGNYLTELSGHSFIGRKNLIILYANNSQIQTIYNTTFSGLRRLTILHLEENRIYRLYGSEFSTLENLRELYLQNNKLTHIGNGTFTNLRKLEILRLDGNKLIQFEVWQLVSNPYLVEISLSDNMWSCECSYLARFRNYLQTNSQKIIDSNRIACVYNNLTSIVKKDKNGTKCTLRDGLSTLVHNNEIENLLPFLLISTCTFIAFFGLILGVFCYRQELRSIWLHSTNQCFCLNLCLKSATNGLNFVHTSSNHGSVGDSAYDNKDHFYDAYLIYSLQDEHFINQILANSLENNLGYRLCLHYRDFNINSYVTDTIIEAVESSKQSVLILSKNFLYNEWNRFEYKNAIHTIMKRRKKFIFILYGDLPQRDIDTDMRHYLKTNACIEWDDKKFWQKLRYVLPNIRKNNHCLAKRSTVNIYATAHDFNNIPSAPPPPIPPPPLPNTTHHNHHHQQQQQQQNQQTSSSTTMPRAGGGSGDYSTTKRFDCNNYATIKDYSLNTSSGGGGGGGGGGGSNHVDGRNFHNSNTSRFDYTTTAKYTTSNHTTLPSTLKNDLNLVNTSSTTVDRKQHHYHHHEYAVPSNCLINGSTNNTANYGISGFMTTTSSSSAAATAAAAAASSSATTTSSIGTNRCNSSCTTVVDTVANNCDYCQNKRLYNKSNIMNNCNNIGGCGISNECNNQSLTNSISDICAGDNNGDGSGGGGANNTIDSNSVNFSSVNNICQNGFSTSLGGGSNNIFNNYNKKNLNNYTNNCNCSTTNSNNLMHNNFDENIRQANGVSQHCNHCVSSPSLNDDVSSLEKRMQQNLWA